MSTSQESFYSEIPIESTDTKRILNLVDKINWITQTFDYESATKEQLNKLKKQYEYASKRIDSLRNEVKTSHKLSVELESYSTLDEFMEKHFNDVSKIKCSEVTKSIRQRCGTKKTKQDIENELKDQNKYKLHNIHNIAYIVQC